MDATRDTSSRSGLEEFVRERNRTICADATLDISARLTALALLHADAVDEETLTLEQVAAQTRTSRRTALRSLRTLELRGLVASSQEGGQTLYRLDSTKIEPESGADTASQRQEAEPW